MLDFSIVSLEDIENELENLDSSKAAPVDDVSANFLKSNMDILLPTITKIINNSFEKRNFPDLLKLGEVSPIFKKKDDLDKENYRPASVFPVVSKVFERIIQGIGKEI